MEANVNKTAPRNDNWRFNAARMLCATVVLGGGLAVDSASAEVDLALHAVNETVQVGEGVNIELYAASDSDEDQFISAVEAVLVWDSISLELLGNNDNGATPLLLSSFPMPDAFGLNSDFQDGDAFYVALANLGEPVAATPSGTLLTTFEFTATEVGTASITLPATHKSGAETIVFGADAPNQDVTGSLIGTTVTVVDAGGTCPADLNADDNVDVADLLILLAEWGACGDPCVADLDDNGFVEVSDLLDLLGAWGPCP